MSPARFRHTVRGSAASSRSVAQQEALHGVSRADVTRRPPASDRCLRAMEVNTSGSERKTLGQRRGCRQVELANSADQIVARVQLIQRSGDPRKAARR